MQLSDFFEPVLVPDLCAEYMPIEDTMKSQVVYGGNQEDYQEAVYLADQDSRKKKDLEKHLNRHGCRLLKQGSKHEKWIKPQKR